MAELVEHRLGRLVRLDGVRQDSHVAEPVDVDAERMLVLAVARVQVAAREDLVHVEAKPVEGSSRERDDVVTLEQRVEVHGSLGRRLLEERIGVMPWPQLRYRAAESGRELLVDCPLPPRERLRRDAVGVGQRLDQLLLVELVDRQREGKPVAMPECSRRLVPKARELADVVGDLRAHGLRRLPGLATLGRIVAVAKDALDLGVPKLDTADESAVA